MKDINEEIVKLAERYANALQEINKLNENNINFNEQEVALAERYAYALQQINKHLENKIY